MYKVVKTIGFSANPVEIKKLIGRAWDIINGRQPKLFSFVTKEELAIKNFLKTFSNEQIHTICPELIFGSLFDKIGFNTVKEEMFRHIVIARLAYPASKLKTVDYLYRYRGIAISDETIYRFLDKLGLSAHTQSVSREGVS